jgi:hypothetical protein
VRIISTSPLSHVVTELGELYPGSPGRGSYIKIGVSVCGVLSSIVSSNTSSPLPREFVLAGHPSGTA